MSTKQVVEQIDHAALCPCGAEPRPGSFYCGDDCTPVPGAGVPLGRDYPATARRRLVPEASAAVPRVDDQVSVVWTAGRVQMGEGS